MPQPTPSPAQPAPRLAIWGALAIVYVVWGSTYLAIRVVVRDLPPFLSAGLRFLAGGLILAAIMAVRHPGSLRVTRTALRNSALVGALLMGGNGLVSLAETPSVGVTSGIAALLVALVPLIVVVLRVGAGERPARLTVLGVMIGFAGLAVLLAPGATQASPLVGGLMVAGGAASWAIGSFYAGRHPMPSNPFVSSAYQMIVGGVMLSLVGVVRGEPSALRLDAVGADAWFALAYLLVAGSLIAFTAYAWLLQRAPVSLVTTYAYVNPVIAVLLGWTLLREPFGQHELLGGAIIVAGVALVISTERRGPSDAKASSG